MIQSVFAVFLYLVFFGVSVVNFEQISHIFLVFLLLVSNKQIPTGWLRQMRNSGLRKSQKNEEELFERGIKVPHILRHLT